MKKTMAVILIFFLGVSMLAAQSTLSGKYTLVSLLDEDGDDLLEIIRGISELVGNDFKTENFYIEFQSGGKFKMFISLFGEEDTAEGTYTVKGNNLTLIAEDNDIMSGTITGNKVILTVEDDGDNSTWVFEKK